MKTVAVIHMPNGGWRIADISNCERCGKIALEGDGTPVIMSPKFEKNGKTLSLIRRFHSNKLSWEDILECKEDELPEHIVELDNSYACTDCFVEK
jgi:hypothetical protein